MRSRAVGSIASFLLLVPIGLAACGGDDDSGGAPITTSADEDESPENVIVSDQDVATGLAETAAKMTALAAAPESATDEGVQDVYELWEGYEGTVKRNEPDMYLNFEDVLGSFKKGAESGDAVAMQSAITEFGKQTATYLAAHPG